MGIYYCTDWLTEIPEEIDHYVADTNFTMPMDVYLYNNYGGVYEQILAWAPNEEQWWITGFNPNHVGRVNANMEVMIGCVDFSGYDELYEKFKLKVESDTLLKDFVIFNENSYIAWLCWYNEEVM